MALIGALDKSKGRKTVDFRFEMVELRESIGRKWSVMSTNGTGANRNEVIRGANRRKDAIESDSLEGLKHGREGGRGRESRRGGRGGRDKRRGREELRGGRGGER